MLRTLRWLLLSLLAACSAPAPLVHEAYVWQRAWSEPLRAALIDPTQPFAVWRVLALEATGQRAVAIAIDAHALAQSGKPVRIVARIEGARLTIAATDVAQHLARAASVLRGAGVKVDGIEIDHDCATAALPHYAQWLGALRSALPDERLSITALPTWLDSPRLPELLARVEHSVLQVHAVAHPREGLFDAARARDWVRRYAELGRPFYVALPAYHVAVSLDAAGAVVGVAAEEADSPAATEVRSDPVQAATLLHSLSGDVRGLIGIVWFRLPLASDRRAWHPRTLRAVVAGDPLAAAVRTETTTGLTVQFALRASGNIDQLAVPVELPASCRYADATPPFALDGRPGAWRLVPQAPVWLKPDERREIGWCRSD